MAKCLDVNLSNLQYRIYGAEGNVLINPNNIQEPVEAMFLQYMISILGRVIPTTLKMILDTSLLNTQQYKVRIKGKVELE